MHSKAEYQLLTRNRMHVLWSVLCALKEEMICGCGREVPTRAQFPCPGAQARVSWSMGVKGDPLRLQLYLVFLLALYIVHNAILWAALSTKPNFKSKMC